MPLLRVCFLFLLLTVLGYPTTKGLRCFSCKNADSNEKCRRSVKCWGGATSCENVIRMENGILRISKGCQQMSACRESSRQNRYQCSPTVRSLLSSTTFSGDKNAPPSVCRSCCTTNNCNRKMFLQEARRAGSGGQGQSQWRKVLPSIRDVQVNLLTPGTAFITFKDTAGHSSDFFDVTLTPTVRSVDPIFLENNRLPGVDTKIPNGTLAFLATGLSAGVQYSIRVVSKEKSRFYSQRIYTTFVTKPRPPSRVRPGSSTATSLRFFIDSPRATGDRDRVNYYSASYRKASDPPQRGRRIPNGANPGLRVIENLEPATEYVIKAWTNVVDSRGRRIASSKPVTTNAFTGVPGVERVDVEVVHATNIQWNFRVPVFARGRVQERFVVSVRDLTYDREIREATIPNSRRTYTADELIPGHRYTFTIKAQARGRESEPTTSRPTATLIRCYSCEGSTNPEECTDYVECPAGSDGCLNIVRRLPLQRRTENPDWYRANMRCKQPNRACNATRNEELAEVCSGRTNNPNAPEVCSCCCDGDLCNGLGTECGHVFQWLGALRAPERLSTTPPFCPKLEIEDGEISCTNEMEIGSTCTFKCIGDRYVVGEENLLCFDNGEWSSSTPTCKPLELCPEIPSPRGTNVRCSNGFKAGSSCRISCNDGYLNPGEDVYRCLHSGNWSEDFIPRCLLINTCQKDPCQNGATCHPIPDNYECECAPGFTGRNCSEEVVCEALVAPENGHLQCTDSNNYPSRCRYMCDDGYELHGSNFTRCLADGYWSAYEPTVCVQVVKSCEVPYLRLVNEGQTHCSGFEVGDSCNFTCPPGLEVASGPSAITCQENQTWSENVPCCDLPCPPHAKVDLYFLLDSSSSLGIKNWKTLINFTVALLDQFVLGPDDMQVGVGRYNYQFDYTNEIQFGDYEDYDDLKKKLYNMPYNGRGTHTGKALKHVYNKSLKSPKVREDVPKVIIVITDGRSKDKVVRPSRLIKSMKNTKVLAIGVYNDPRGRVHRDELEVIATGPQYVHVITEGYEQLAQELSTTVIEDVCWVPCEFQYGLRELYLRQRQLAAMTGDAIDAEFWAHYDSLNVTTTISPTTGISTTRPQIPVEPLDGAEGPFELEELAST